jgi:hypothetical protein
MIYNKQEDLVARTIYYSRSSIPDCITPWELVRQDARAYWYDLARAAIAVMPTPVTKESIIRKPERYKATRLGVMFGSIPP